MEILLVDIIARVCQESLLVLSVEKDMLWNGH